MSNVTTEESLKSRGFALRKIAEVIAQVPESFPALSHEIELLLGQFRQISKVSNLSRDTLQQAIVSLKDNERIGIGRDLSRASEYDYFLVAMDFDDYPEQISRLHCEITFKDNKLFITDKGSTCGTLLNGCYLQPESETLLCTSDYLKFGKRCRTYMITQSRQPNRQTSESEALWY